MLKIDSVSFRNAGFQMPVQSVSVSKNENQTNSDKKMSNKTKALIGTSLVALAALGIYIATRKGKKSEQIKTNIPEPAMEFIDTTIEEFKEMGRKIVGGKATDGNGEILRGFCGSIRNISKKNDEVILKFEKGILKESYTNAQIKCRDGQVLSLPKIKRVYNYNSDGKLKNVKTSIYTHVPSSTSEHGGFKWVEQGVEDVKKDYKTRLEILGENREIRIQKEIELKNRQKEKELQQQMEQQYKEQYAKKEKEYNDLFKSYGQFTGEIQDGENMFVVEKGIVQEAKNQYGQKWNFYAEETLPEYKEKIERIIDIKSLYDKKPEKLST